MFRAACCSDLAERRRVNSVLCCDMAACNRAVNSSGVVMPVIRAMTDIAVADVGAMRIAEGNVDMRSSEATWYVSES